ncbi:MAG TPA: ABC transporter ATP-binding protein, partial [Nitriliruptorales bacterium]
MALLEVTDVTAAYGAVTALRGITMQVEAHERIALLGANGAGKTTTLRMLSGLVSPKSGTVVLDGKRIDRLPAHKVVGHGVGHVPEGRELFPDLGVEENLRYGYWPRHKDKGGYKRQLDMVYEMFPRLKERRRQHAITLSGGEQLMLVVARALMSSPKLLMCDELSLGLAPKIVSQLYEILAAVNEQGTAVIIVEQFVHTA